MTGSSSTLTTPPNKGSNVVLAEHTYKSIILVIFLLSMSMTVSGCKQTSTPENNSTVYKYETETREYTEEISTDETSTTVSTECTTEYIQIETTEEVTEDSITPTYFFSNDEYSALILAKIIYGEARGVHSITEQACIAWTVLNRVDYYGESIEYVATSPNQFAYSYYFPTVDDYGRDLFHLARDILGRWEAEKEGNEDVGRVLPKDYLWYAGDGFHNYFRNSYEGGTTWNYSLTSPYES